MNPTQPQPQTRKPNVFTIRNGVIALLVFLVVWGLIWVITHGRITLSFPDDTTARSIQVIRQDTGDVVRSETTTDSTYSTILSSGGYEVKVSQDLDRKASSYILTAPYFLGKSETNILIDNQFSRTKIGSSTSACPAYSGKNLYSYNCSGSLGNFYLHTPQKGREFSSKVLLNEFDEAGIIDMQPYQNKLLVMIQTEDGLSPSLLLLDKGKIIRSITLPESFFSDNNDYDLATDLAGGSTFAVSNGTGEQVLVFSNFKDGAAKSIKMNSVEYTGTGTFAGLYGDRLVIAFGQSSYALKTAARTEIGTSFNLKTDVLLFDINSGEQITTSKIPGYTDDFDFCAKDLLCQINNTGLHVYSLENNKIGDDYTISNVDSFANMDDDRFVYSQNDRVFVIHKERRSGLAFYDESVTVSGLYTMQDTPLLITTPKGSEGTANNNAFLLGSEPAKTNTFIDQRFPYSPGDFGYIRESDYRGKNILISLVVSQTNRFADTGEGQDYSTSDFNRKKKDVLKQLKKDGITPSNYNITIIPTAY